MEEEGARRLCLFLQIMPGVPDQQLALLQQIVVELRRIESLLFVQSGLPGNGVLHDLPKVPPAVPEIAILP